MITRRQLTPSDMTDITRLEADLYVPALRISDASFRQLLALFADGALGVFDDGNLCGFVFALPLRSGTVLDLDAPLEQLPSDADALYIHNLGVAPAHRGRGLADELIAAAFAVARSRRLRVCELVSVHGSEPFWERYGFERLAAFEYAPGEPATQMRKALPVGTSR
ncbi:MAG: GNAT family N-acetyltransferase [Vicinamibacterales bacterium]